MTNTEFDKTFEALVNAKQSSSSGEEFVIFNDFSMNAKFDPTVKVRLEQAMKNHPAFNDSEIFLYMRRLK